MPDHRSGGPVAVTFQHTGGVVELRIEDLSCGGGTTIQFPTAAWAQTWLDELARQLAELEHDEVFGR